MNSILQGTTPVFKISINPEDLSLEDVVELELVFKQFNKDIIIKHKADCHIDTAENTISYHFTEVETLNLIPTTPLNWQLRFATSDGERVGTEIASIKVSDLISEEVMTV